MRNLLVEVLSDCSSGFVSKSVRRCFLFRPIYSSCICSAHTMVFVLFFILFGGWHLSKHKCAVPEPSAPAADRPLILLWTAWQRVRCGRAVDVDVFEDRIVRIVNPFHIYYSATTNNCDHLPNPWGTGWTLYDVHVQPKNSRKGMLCSFFFNIRHFHTDYVNPTGTAPCYGYGPFYYASPKEKCVSDIRYAIAEWQVWSKNHKLPEVF